MNGFIFNRFCKTFRWFFGVNLRSMMMWSSGYVVGVFLGEVLFFALNPNGSMEIKLQSVGQFCTVFIMIALAIGACTFLSDFNKKPRREAFLMLPASNLEKYLTAILYIASFFTACVLLSFALGDTLRMVFRSLVFGDEWVSTVPIVAKNLIPNTMFNDATHAYSLSFRVMNLFVGYSFLLWMHSLYTLGGTFFRKYAFVATSVVLVASLSLLSWVLNHFEVSMFNSQWDGNAYVGEEVGIAAYMLAVVMPLLSIFNYWASFHIFKGYQLITNKWTNYDILKR